MNFDSMCLFPPVVLSLLLCLQRALPSLCSEAGDRRQQQQEPHTRLLVYVPVSSAEEPLRAFGELSRCVLDKRATMDDKLFADLLVVVHGAGPAVITTGLKKEVDTAVEAASFLRRGFVEIYKTPDDAVTRTSVQVANKVNQLPWNLISTQLVFAVSTHRKFSHRKLSSFEICKVFYETFEASGRYFGIYASHYQFILQLATDTCALSEAWLDALLAPFDVDSNILISSSSGFQDSSCSHLDCNALYRTGGALQELLKHAAAQDSLETSSDYSLLNSASNVGMLGALHNNPSLFQASASIDEAFVWETQYYPNGTLLVHAPRHLQLPFLDAGLGRLDLGRAVTATFVSDSHVEFLEIALTSAQEKGTTNLLVFVFSEKLFFFLHRKYGHLFSIVRVPGVDAGGSTVYRSPDYDVVVDRKSELVIELLYRKLDVVSMDCDVFVTGDYNAFLAGLPRSGIYFSSDVPYSTGRISHGLQRPRFLFNAGVFFVPYSEQAVTFMKAWNDEMHSGGLHEQPTLNKMVQCFNAADCAYRGFKVNVLPETLFVNGANFFSVPWPTPELLRAALVVHNNWANGADAKVFRYRTAGMWPRAHKRVCTRAAAFHDDKPVYLSPASARDVLYDLLHFLVFSRRLQVDCLVVPSLLIERTGVETHIDTILDLNAVTAYTGATLLPGKTWIAQVDEWVEFFGGQSTYQHQHQAKHRHRKPPPAFPPSLYEAQVFSPVLARYVSMFGNRFVCLHDTRRLGEVALRAYRGEAEKFVQHLEQMLPDGKDFILLAGKWRVLGQAINGLSAKVRTVGAPFFPVHTATYFGAPWLYGTPGSGVFYDVLEAALCSNHSWLDNTSVEASWERLSRRELFFETMRHFPERVLAEDLAVLARHPAVLANLVNQRHLVTLRVLEAGIGAADRASLDAELQTLVYIARETRSSCFLPMTAYAPSGNSTLMTLWADAFASKSFFGSFGFVAPPSLQLLLYPALLLDQKQQLALSPNGKLLHQEQLARLIREHRKVVDEGLLRMIDVSWQSSAFPQRLYPSSHEGGQQLAMTGKFVLSPSWPHLGLSDDDVIVGFSLFGRDRTIALDFSNGTLGRFAFEPENLAHNAFLQTWTQSYVLPNA